MNWGHKVTPEGVIFESKDRAKSYADLYDKDLVEAESGWLAKNRATNAPPMPTKDGDVVVYHLHQMYRVRGGLLQPEREVESSSGRGRCPYATSVFRDTWREDFLARRVVAFSVPCSSRSACNQSARSRPCSHPRARNRS